MPAPHPMTPRGAAPTDPTPDSEPRQRPVGPPPAVGWSAAEPDPESRPAPARLAGDGPSLVVVGVDGTPSAWHAFAWACGHARRSHCPVLAIYASNTGFLDCSIPAGMAAAAAAQAALEVAGNLREEVLRAAADFGVPVRFEHHRGDPARALAGAADTHNADLVVIGASRPLHRLAGSMAGKLARTGRLPLVVVP